MKKLLFYICLPLLAVSCEKEPDMTELDADLAVYTDYDSSVDFGSYKTYFLPDSILEAGEYKATYWKDENAMKIIKAVETNMNQRGYTRITDPNEKDNADIGIQLSYLNESYQIVSGGYFGGWWDYGYWGPWWGGWYYPYPITYSYDTNTLVMEMVDLTASGESENNRLPVVWYANASGFDFGGRYSLKLLEDAVVQSFVQSPYVQSAN